MNTLEQKRELKQRMVWGSIFFLALLLLLVFSTVPFLIPLFLAFISVVAGIGLWEFFQLTKVRGAKPLLKLGITCQVLMIFLSYYQSFLFQSSPFLWLPVLLTFVAFIYFLFHKRNALISVASTLLGLIYIGIPMALMVKIVYFPFSDTSSMGIIWLLYLILVTKVTDIGAFFTGKKIGKRKLAPHISPNKTVEGFLGGAILGIVLSILAYYIVSVLGFSKHFLSLKWAFFMGGGIGLLGQVGDLIESQLKREAKVKDSNRLPGFGGVLDLLDSLLITTPLVYAYLVIMA